MQPEDAPDLLKDQAERDCRIGMLTLPHMKPLTDYLVSVRAKCGQDHHIPDFDPCDGGIQARALFLLEAPGPKARNGFVSRNNPDPTAKNLWQLMQDTGIPRQDTLIWNICPWYVGENGHILPVRAKDIQEALPYLRELLDLLPHLQKIVLVGKRAQSAKPFILSITSLPTMGTWHMSALVFNRWPDKKKKTQEDFAAIAQFLRENKER